jgi:hypothetical protein
MIKKSSITVLVGIALVGAIFVGAAETTTKCPRVVVRAAFDDPTMVSEVTRWADPWEINRAESYLVVEVSEREILRLETAGFRVEVDQELTDMMCAPRRPIAHQKAGIAGLPCYRTVDETFADVEILISRYPSLTEWIDIGDSWEVHSGWEPGFEGDDLMVLKLGNKQTAGVGTPAAPDTKPILFVQGSIHARECPAPELLTRFAEELLAGYDIDADSTWLLDEHEIHLLLFLNPDGRRRAELGMWWRKNANNNHCGNTVDRGIDLNRNFEFEWNCCGQSSEIECDQTYHGTGGASEPETRAVQDYLRSIFPDQWRPVPAADATGVFIDLHSYGREIYWPWFHTAEATPNRTSLVTLGRKLARFTGYDPLEILGSLDGSAVDFAYGDLGVASFLFELGTAFFQDCDRFETRILPYNIQALRFAAKVARTPYLTPAGPEITSLEIPGKPQVYGGQPLRIEARADDSKYHSNNGSEPVQNVVSVRVWVDRPPWHPSPGQSWQMLPIDGAYDSFFERVELDLDTTGLGADRHTLFVQAEDAHGNLGPVSAEFFWVIGSDGGTRQAAGRVAP